MVLMNAREMEQIKMAGLFLLKETQRLANQMMLS